MSDSLMFKMIYKENTEIDRDELEKQTNDILNKEFDKRYRGGKPRKQIAVGKDSTLNANIVYEEDEMNDRRQAFKDSILDALTTFDANEMQARITKKVDSMKAVRKNEIGWNERLERVKIGYEIRTEDEEKSTFIDKITPKN